MNHKYVFYDFLLYKKSFLCQMASFYLYYSIFATQYFQ